MPGTTQVDSNASATRLSSVAPQKHVIIRLASTIVIPRVDTVRGPAELTRTRGKLGFLWHVFRQVSLDSQNRSDTGPD